MDGAIPAAALPAAWVLVLDARSFFAALAAAAACASVTLSKSGTGSGTGAGTAAAAVGLASRPCSCTWALSPAGCLLIICVTKAYAISALYIRTECVA